MEGSLVIQNPSLNLKVLNWGRDKDKPVKIVYEAVVEAVAWIFKNHNKEQLATKVEFEGSIKNPNIDIWQLIGQVLKNAFIQALYPSLENSVSINAVGGKGGGKVSPMQKEIANSGGTLKNKTEQKKSKKELRKEKQQRKKPQKKKKKRRKRIRIKLPKNVDQNNQL